MIQIKLSDLVDAIQLDSDESESFINLKTGEICLITDEFIHMSDDDDGPDWQKEIMETIRHYLENPDDYLAVPSSHDVGEYQMMEYFTENVEDKKIAALLLNNLKGKGAFRRFKDAVILLGIDEQWYKFKDKQYREFAIQWCADNEIGVEDEVAV